ncbi:MAG: tetratricopeptide repeat protein [Puniceicoccaceae bacterium]
MNPTTPRENGSSPDDLSFEIRFFENLSRRDPKDVRVLEVLAHHYTKSGRISDGLRIDRRIVRHDPANPLAHYNLACSLALKKRKKEAVESLCVAVERGYGDIDWMLRDDDLASLREYAPFLQLVKRVVHESETGGR